MEELLKRLKEVLTKDHYEHSLRTAELAKEIATAHGLDKDKAYLAGLLHDYTKSMNWSEMISKANELGFEINYVEKAFPYLLHAKLAAKLVQVELNLNDSDIISAIEKHTFGDIEMSDLDKIIYIADMTEPGRPHKELEDLRKKAMVDINEAFKDAYVFSVKRLVETRRLLHPQTLDVWNKLIVGGVET